MKKLISILLATSLILTLAIPVIAANIQITMGNDNDEEYAIADINVTQMEFTDTEIPGPDVKSPEMDFFLVPNHRKL